MIAIEIQNEKMIQPGEDFSLLGLSG